MISAPVKIILIGEHAVVHGAPAISLPLPFCTTVTLQSQNSEGISIVSNQPLSTKNEVKLKEQIHLILQYLNQREVPNLNAQIHLSVPAGVGFGISASVAVALVKAFCKFFQQELSEKALFEIVQKLEEKNHGKPSGLDHTTIILDQPLVFQNPDKIKKLRIKKGILQNLYLINTGKPEETTKEMVDFVAGQLRKFPRQTRILFQKIKLLVPIVSSALERNDQIVFREIMNEAGMILEGLGIVSERAKKLSAEIREAGGMAKISGAGGRKGNGSGILLVWHEDKNFVEEICRKQGFEYWSGGT